MKKRIVLCAAALLVTACAKVEGENRNRNQVSPFVGNSVPQQPVPPMQQNLGPQLQPGGGSLLNRPVGNVQIKTACVANVIREVRFVQVEKYERKSPNKIVVSEGSSLLSTAETTIKMAAGRVLSKDKETGSASETTDTYNFASKTIESDDKKLRFFLNKELSEKSKKDIFSVNEGDLTAHVYGSIDDEENRLSKKGQERVCSYRATGRFFLNSKASTVESRVVLTEARQLDAVALKSLRRELRRK